MACYCVSKRLLNNFFIEKFFEEKNKRTTKSVNILSASTTKKIAMKKTDRPHSSNLKMQTTENNWKNFE